jgi:hypothetical protein
MGGHLPAHNGGGGDAKSPTTPSARLSPQLVVPAHIPPKIHGPFPSDLSYQRAAETGAGRTPRSAVSRVDLVEAVYRKVGLSRSESARLVEQALKEITDWLERRRHCEAVLVRIVRGAHHGAASGPKSEDRGRGSDRPPKGDSIQAVGDAQETARQQTNDRLTDIGLCSNRSSIRPRPAIFVRPSFSDQFLFGIGSRVHTTAPILTGTSVGVQPPNRIAHCEIS